MKKHLLISFLIVSFTIKLSAQKQIIHYNLLFAPDLSNRLNHKLYPKPVNDVDIVDSVLQKAWPKILRSKRVEGQKDHYRIDFINKGLIGIYKINTDVLAIDFERFDRHSDRIDYIMSRNGVPRTFPGDIKKLTAEYRRFNEKAAISSHGADIWTYFKSGVDSRIILADIPDGKVTHKFRNIMVLLTDGYIEAGIFGKGYDLSESKIEAFRNAFLKSKESNLTVFLSKNPKFKIKPADNPYLKNLEVIVLEMYDRSLSKTGIATKHPTDMEIMKLIWSDWLKSSGVKRFELKSIATSKEEAVKYVMDFIK